jgi:hypothetical protein
MDEFFDELRLRQIPLSVSVKRFGGFEGFIGSAGQLQGPLRCAANQPRDRVTFRFSVGKCWPVKDLDCSKNDGAPCPIA